MDEYFKCRFRSKLIGPKTPFSSRIIIFASPEVLRVTSDLDNLTFLMNKTIILRTPRRVIVSGVRKLGPRSWIKKLELSNQRKLLITPAVF